MAKVKTAGITGITKNKPAISAAKKSIKLIEKAGLDYEIDDAFMKGKPQLPIKDFKSDMIFCFGGDGTILATFRKLGEKQIPVLGINFGEKGFLTSLNQQNFMNAIPSILEGNYKLEKRTRLQAFADGEKLPLALNDIALCPVKSVTVLNYSVKTENNFFSDSADGILVSTPTGSTAYSLSLGGPIIEEKTPVLIISPINSLCNTSKVIVNNNEKIEIEKISSKSKCEVILDGFFRHELAKLLEIKKAQKDAILAVPSEIPKISKFSAEKFRELTPTAKLVYKVLEFRKNMTQQGIIAETQLPGRTVRRSLELLLEKNFTIQKQSPGDMRQKIYSVQ